MVTSWLLPVYCLVTSWLLPEYCQYNSWLLPGYYLVTTCLLPYCLVTFWLLPVYFILTSWLLTCFFIVIFCLLPGYFLVANWLLPCYFLVSAWLLLGCFLVTVSYYLVTAWLLPGYYQVTAWLLRSCSRLLVTAGLLSGYFMLSFWLLPGYCVVISWLSVSPKEEIWISCACAITFQLASTTSNNVAQHVFTSWCSVSCSVNPDIYGSRKFITVYTTAHTYTKMSLGNRKREVHACPLVAFQWGGHFAKYFHVDSWQGVIFEIISFGIFFTISRSCYESPCYMARFENADSKRGREIHMYSKQPSAFHYELCTITLPADVPYSSVSQPPGCGPIPGPGINWLDRETLCWNLSFSLSKQFSWICVL